MILAGNVAIITGASQGLGRAIAERFVAEGASVMLCARSAEDIEATCATLRANAGAGQQIAGMACDVADPPACDLLIAEALRQFQRIDVLVNNAGIYGPMGGIETTDWPDWVQAIQINLLGTVYLCRMVVPHMRARGTGKIINISGGGATSPLPQISAYAASKAAVVRFSETLAEELRGAGIDVNSLAPGALNTRLMTQLLEAGPERVGSAMFERMSKISREGATSPSIGAGCCAWLASKASNGITGKLISAQWDQWATLGDHLKELQSSDIYTLRRIVPEDRGQEWDKP